jgi:alkylhydroperoxidase/carboxymuconolactone decarboxylase family protein YurZ
MRDPAAPETLTIDRINFRHQVCETLRCLRREELAMIGKAPTTEDRIRAGARGDFESLSFGVVPNMQNGAPGGSGLDAETCQLVQIAALVAIDAPHVSWLRHLEAADEQAIELDKILGTLLCVAPVVGSAKIVAACAKIVRAAALGEEFGVLAET